MREPSQLPSSRLLCTQECCKCSTTNSLAPFLPEVCCQVLTLTLVRSQASEPATPPPSPAEAPEAEDTGGSQMEANVASEGAAAAASDDAPAASDPTSSSDADELQPPVHLWLLSLLTVAWCVYQRARQPLLHMC